MKKKVTNDDVGKVLGEIADRLRSEMDFEFRVARSQMLIAEKDLIDSLNENQLNIYKEYNEKREVFLKIASELYHRKY